MLFVGNSIIGAKRIKTPIALSNEPVFNNLVYTELGHLQSIIKMVLTHHLCTNDLFSSTQVVIIIINGPPFFSFFFFFWVHVNSLSSVPSLRIKTVHQKFNLNDNHEDASETVLVGWIHCMSCFKVHVQSYTF